MSDEREFSFPMDEQECLAAIATGDVDAAGLLGMADPKLARRFRRVDKAIRDLLGAAQEHFPDACYYTAGGGFHLMLGNPQDARANGQQQLVAIDGRARISDGDF